MKIDIEKIKKNKKTKDLINFGIINIDKPSGPVSFQVSDYVKVKLSINKTSHLGTLDPGVSGVLPIALGRACKLAKYLMGSRKKYVGIMRLHKDINEKELDDSLKDFVGKIKQIPPVRSSVKRVSREREVYSFEIIEKDGKDVLFSCDVQAGTYIRTIINDLGKKIGGAHMTELRRVEAGIFNENKSYSLYDFDRAVEALNNENDKLIREIIVPGEVIGNILEPVEANSKNVDKYLRGSPIHKGEIKAESKKEEIIAVFSKDRFVGCYKIVNSKDIVAVPDFVFN